MRSEEEIAEILSGEITERLDYHYSKMSVFVISLLIAIVVVVISSKISSDYKIPVLVGVTCVMFIGIATFVANGKRVEIKLAKNNQGRPILSIRDTKNEKIISWPFNFKAEIQRVNSYRGYINYRVSDKFRLYIHKGDILYILVEDAPFRIIEDGSLVQMPRFWSTESKDIVYHYSKFYLTDLFNNKKRVFYSRNPTTEIIIRIYSTLNSMTSELLVQDQDNRLILKEKQTQ
ncbi:MAG TPA: hypothetical protein PLP35_07090 [Caldisericia bacterium]|nr:hypothetical protein [Caldisericia bacterium]HRV75588.1 hypothetical protein [Caldisericia bacterium]